MFLFDPEKGSLYQQCVCMCVRGCAVGSAYRPTVLASVPKEGPRTVGSISEPTVLGSSFVKPAHCSCFMQKLLFNIFSLSFKNF